MIRSSDRIDSADGAVTIILDQEVPDNVFALNVAQSGVVAFIGNDGNESDVFIVAGIVFPIKVRSVLSQGTTAQGIRGLV